jgi:hypothetical protein
MINAKFKMIQSGAFSRTAIDYRFTAILHLAFGIWHQASWYSGIDRIK